MIFTALAEYLAGAMPQLVMGESLFLNRIPAEVGDAAMIRNNNSYDGIQIDHEIDGLRKGKFTVIYRAREPGAGEALASQIAAALTITQETVMGSYLVKQLLPQFEPVAYPISEGKNVEFAVGFSIVYAIIK